MTINDLFRRLAVRATANTLSQNLLEKCMVISLYLRGIGSGGNPWSSGEAEITLTLKTRKRAGRPLMIFDVGANKGQFLDTVQKKLAGENFLVHSFEPGKEAFAMLRKDAARFANVTLNNCALGKQTGEATLFYDGPGSQLASLSKRQLDHAGLKFDQSESVEIDTVDNFCEKHNVDAIDLLKLDVEGHELDVLQGAASMFDKGRIGSVIFEFGGANLDSRTYFRDFFDFFSRYSAARIYCITPSGLLTRISKYKESLEQFRTTCFLVMLDVPNAERSG